MAEPQPKPETKEPEKKAPEPTPEAPKPKLKEYIVIPGSVPQPKLPEYSMRGDSAFRPFRFNDSEKFIAEDNFYYQNVVKEKNLSSDIAESMKWENLYYDEIEDYNRKLWLTILICALVIAGRMLL